jgi:hypothetical protein
MADRRITVIRRSANIVDSFTLSAAPFSKTADRQPVVAALVEVEVSGSAPFGTVTVNGDIGGLPAARPLVFSAAETLATVERFDAGSITGFDFTGFSASSTCLIRSVGSDGSREHIPSTVVTDWPARKDAGIARWPHPTSGSEGSEETRFYVDYNTVWTPRRGDVIVDQRTSEEWLVVGKPEQHGGGMTEPHHWEIRVDERKGSSTT